MNITKLLPAVLVCTLALSALQVSVAAQSGLPAATAASPANRPGDEPAKGSDSSLFGPSSASREVKSAIPAHIPVEPQISFTAPSLELEKDLSSLHKIKVEQYLFTAPERESDQAPRVFEATAYIINGRTASGVRTQRGVIAADPKVLPLGSVVEVKAGEYSGVYTVHDTGAAVKGRRIDVWMPSSREARSFGRRHIKLTVLRYGPGQAARQVGQAAPKTNRARRQAKH